MSNKIQEKQPQKDNKRELDADDIFNQQLFKTLAYAGAGFGAGIVASVFLKHRKALSLIGAGTGAAYGYNNFMSELNSFNRFKDMANQAQQPQTLKRADQGTKNWDDFMPKQENLTQKQQRFGGSDDDHNKEQRQESKGKEQQKPTQMHKKETDLKDTDKQGGQQSKSSTPSSKDSDRSSQLKNVNKGQEQQKPTQMHKKETDLKDADRQSGSKVPQKSAPSPKESDKNLQQQQQQQQKGDSQKKESQGKGDSQKKESQDKENQRSFFSWGRNVKGESNLTAGSESKSPNLGAQHLQDFKTNPGPGKPAPGENAYHRGAERELHGKHEVGESNQQTRMVKQDANYKSTRTGAKMKVEPNPENIAGGQFSERGLTAKDQVNAVIE